MAETLLDTMSGASTGTVVVRDALNFWAGKRVQPRQERNAEPVFEPATGKSVTFYLLFYFTLQPRSYIRSIPSYKSDLRVNKPEEILLKAMSLILKLHL